MGKDVGNMQMARKQYQLTQQKIETREGKIHEIDLSVNLD